MPTGKSYGEEIVMGHVSQSIELIRKQAECDHQEIDWSFPSRKPTESNPEYVARVLRRRTWKGKEYVGIPLTCLDCDAKGVEWYEWSEDEWDQP